MWIGRMQGAYDRWKWEVSGNRIAPGFWHELCLKCLLARGIGMCWEACQNTTSHYRWVSHTRGPFGRVLASASAPAPTEALPNRLVQKNFAGGPESHYRWVSHTRGPFAGARFLQQARARRPAARPRLALLCGDHTSRCYSPRLTLQVSCCRSNFPWNNHKNLPVQSEEPDDRSMQNFFKKGACRWRSVPPATCALWLNACINI